jgi:hypothetical protein
MVFQTIDKRKEGSNGKTEAVQSIYSEFLDSWQFAWRTCEKDNTNTAHGQEEGQIAIAVLRVKHKVSKKGGEQ